MNKLQQRFFHLITIYAKLEIVSGLMLVTILLGYLVVTNKNSKQELSVPNNSSTIEIQK